MGGGCVCVGGREKKSGCVKICSGFLTDKQHGGVRKRAARGKEWRETQAEDRLHSAPLLLFKSDNHHHDPDWRSDQRQSEETDTNHKG